MSASNFSYEYLFTRNGFNQSLSHFQTVNEIIPDLSDGINLADILNSMLADNEIMQNQIQPILHALLVDKFGYRYKSLNLSRTFEDFAPVQETASKWKAIDIVLAYHHPELGMVLINPKNSESWNAVNILKNNELITVYCGAFDEEGDDAVLKLGLARTAELLEKGKAGADEKLRKGSFTYVPYEEEDEEPAPQPEVSRTAVESAPETPAPPKAPPKRTGRMTPMYSVPVTNELFHNGNVEAWKKVIQSYRAKYPQLDVYIYYDGERIHDIHALFKWGKVKHGSAILFAVAGENVKDIAKLQRYLRQGASPRFEDFLRFPVNVVLKLF